MFQPEGGKCKKLMGGAELCTTGDQKQRSLWLQQSEGEERGVLKEIRIWEMMEKSMDFILRSMEN